MSLKYEPSSESSNLCEVVVLKLSISSAPSVVYLVHLLKKILDVTRQHILLDVQGAVLALRVRQ